ncbi:MAG TPA: amino acid permease C-terminal domain-containing protein [Vicinamibacterales bacterium]|nr:amino acid permease C-terminal domain-containing protein [Vicinamibacterales bacterium]
MGILIAFLLMASLPWDTWLRLIVWLAAGLVVYWRYGRHHSRLRQERRSPDPTVVREG